MKWNLKFQQLSGNFLNHEYGILVRGPEVLAVNQTDNGSLDLDEIMLRAGMLLRSIDPVKGRRRYEGETSVNGQPVLVVVTPYADAGIDNTRFRTAFPLLLRNYWPGFATFFKDARP